MRVEKLLGDLPVAPKGTRFILQAHVASEKFVDLRLSDTAVSLEISTVYGSCDPSEDASAFTLLKYVATKKGNRLEASEYGGDLECLEIIERLTKDLARKDCNVSVVMCEGDLPK